jgi:hypothetical protein
MFRVVGPFPKASRSAGIVLASALLFTGLNSFPQNSPPQLAARYASFAEAKLTLDHYRQSSLPGSEITSETEWNQWIRLQDSDVRSRIDGGVEDSINNFILYGTSFTKLPRLRGSDDALNSAGQLTSMATARVRALALALRRAQPGERLEFIRHFLAKKGIGGAEFDHFLTANLVRFAQEQRAYQQKLEEAGKSGDTDEVMAVRGTLYEKRGLSVDTSMLPNFAIEETLRAMMNKGALKQESIHRIAIIGPGLDFTDKRDGYDFYPLQTIQPFAVLETVRRLNLSEPGAVQVVTMDLNAAVNAHVAQLAARARNGQSYTIQLPRDTNAAWSDAAIGYWKQFGSVLGTPAKPLPVPDALPGIESRAVAIRAEYAASITPLDLNIIAQTSDLPEGQGFDLVVATNILVYYDVFQQALAMSNIGHLMNPGGIFVANNALPAAHDSRLKYLGRKNVLFAKDGSYGDDVVVYQRQ